MVNLRFLLGNMNLSEFQEKARELAGHDDYIENDDLLELIPPEQRMNYIAALASGYKMKASFSGLSKALDIANHLNLTVDKVFFSIQHFLSLIKVLKGFEDISDPVADVMDVIDESKSYQELIFLRDHLEYRITTYLAKLKPGSNAFSELWIKKRCPACGQPNHIYDSNCQVCGWEPN